MGNNLLYDNKKIEIKQDPTIKEELNVNQIKNPSIILNQKIIENVNDIIPKVQSPPLLSNKIEETEKTEKITLISQHASPTFLKISLKSSQSVLQSAPIAVRTGASELGNDQGKINSAERTSNDVIVSTSKNLACSDTVDPFNGESVENFVPPKNADILSKNQWADSVKLMLLKISKLQVGGDKLKNILNEEIVILSKLRKDLFCKYV